jgi:hypothetical protein
VPPGVLSASAADFYESLGSHKRVAGHQLANRAQSFALCPLRFGYGGGFSLTLAFMSARIRSLSDS